MPIIVVIDIFWGEPTNALALHAGDTFLWFINLELQVNSNESLAGYFSDLFC